MMYEPEHDQYTCRDCGDIADRGRVKYTTRLTIDEADATYICVRCCNERRDAERQTYTPQLVTEPRYTDKPTEQMTALDWYWEDQYRQDELDREDLDRAGANGAR